MSSSDRQIYALLAGGIGNQLFQYSYACKMAETHGGQISLDLRALPSKGQQKGSSITELDIYFQSTRIGTTIFKNFWKFAILQAVRGRPSPFSDILLGVRRDGSPAPKKRKDFSSASYAEDSKAIESFTGTIPLSLNMSPDENLRREYNIVMQPHTVTIHHRLGDSLTLKNTRGQLGQEYFQGAISEIRKKNPDISHVHVYSDDPVHSQNLLRNWLGGLHLTWAPEEFSAAEVISSLARAKYLVLSNSTMSWWAAAAGEHLAVVAPLEWDVSGNNELNIDKWILVGPDWN